MSGHASSRAPRRHYSLGAPHPARAVRTVHAWAVFQFPADFGRGGRAAGTPDRHWDDTSRREGTSRTVSTGSTRHRVAVIGGDGIGPEVCAEALKVVAAAGVDLDTTDFDLGAARYLRDGVVLPDETLDELRGLRRHPPRRGRPAGRRHRRPARHARAGPPAAPALRARPLRQPAPVHRRARAPSPRAPTSPSCGRTPRAPTPARAASCARARPHEVATQGSVNTRMGVERCVRFAFELAGTPQQHVSPWCTRRTCSPSPATCGSGPSPRSPPSTPTSTLGLQPRRRRLHLPGRAARSATT